MLDLLFYGCGKAYFIRSEAEIACQAHGEFVIHFYSLFIEWYL